MPAIARIPASSYRIVQRKSLCQRPYLAIPSVRPSLLDIGLSGDPWIGFHDRDRLTLFIGERPLASFPGSGPDQAALNQLLFSLRSRRGLTGP